MDQLSLVSGVTVDLDEVPALVHWQLDAPRIGAPGATAVGREEAHRFIDDLHRAGTLVLAAHVWRSRAQTDLVELVAHATQLGLTTWLVHDDEPNCEPSLLSALRSAGLGEIAIRIDGADGASHDARRGREGSFAAASRALRDATRAGIQARADTRIYPGLVNEVEQVMQTAVDLGCARHHFVFPTSGDGWVPTAAEAETLLVRLAQLESDAAPALLTSAAPQLERVRRSLQLNGGAAGGSKAASTVFLSDGRGTLFVSFDGRIYPSPELRVPCSKLSVHELIETYRYHPLFRTLRDAKELQGRCGRCEFAAACGGSRARAYNLCGRLLGSDPLCAYDPPSGRGLSFL